MIKMKKKVLILKLINLNNFIYHLVMIHQIKKHNYIFKERNMVAYNKKQDQ